MAEVARLVEWGGKDEAPKGSEAVLKVLQVNENRYFSVADMVKALSDRGWQPDSDDPANVVRTALERLHKANTPGIKKIRREGAVLYRYNEPEPPDVVPALAFDPMQTMLSGGTHPEQEGASDRSGQGPGGPKVCGPTPQVPSLSGVAGSPGQVYEAPPDGFDSRYLHACYGIRILPGQKGLRTRLGLRLLAPRPIPVRALALWAHPRTVGLGLHVARHPLVAAPLALPSPYLDLHCRPFAGARYCVLKYIPPRY